MLKSSLCVGNHKQFSRIEAQANWKIYSIYICNWAVSVNRQVVMSATNPKGPYLTIDSI